MGQITMKHNKKRNTGFIYEILSRELTKAIVTTNSPPPEGNKKLAVTNIIKKFFNKNSILAEELRLYSILLDSENLPESLAERTLQEAKKAYSLLNKEEIFESQSGLISAINKSLGQDTWSNFVPNFKSLASIAAIFNEKTGVKKRVLFEQAIVNDMVTKNPRSADAPLEPLDSIVYNSFIKKFNNKYQELLHEQKEILSCYITSFSDDGFLLRVRLNEELARLKSIIEAYPENKSEPLIVQKLDKVYEYLEEFRKREFTDQDLNKILKTQALVQELTSNDNN